MFRNLKVVLIVLVALVLGISGYAFAAGNSIPESAAGSSGKTVSGYTVTNIAYNLNTSDATKVDTITFAVAPTAVDGPAATTVRLQTAASGDWTDCTLAADTGTTMDATCTYSSLLAADITAFNLVATSSYVAP